MVAVGFIPPIRLFNRAGTDRIDPLFPSSRKAAAPPTRARILDSSCFFGGLISTCCLNAVATSFRARLVAATPRRLVPFWTAPSCGSLLASLLLPPPTRASSRRLREVINSLLTRLIFSAVATSAAALIRPGNCLRLMLPEVRPTIGILCWTGDGACW